MSRFKVWCIAAVFSGLVALVLLGAVIAFNVVMGDVTVFSVVPVALFLAALYLTSVAVERAWLERRR